MSVFASEHPRVHASRATASKEKQSLAPRHRHDGASPLNYTRKFSITPAAPIPPPTHIVQSP